MDRVDFYFKQRVTEAELDYAFDAVEQAMWNMVLDLEAYGITSGIVPDENSPPDLYIRVSAGVGYDQLGRRAYREAAGLVDMSQDYTGIPSEPSFLGWERWCSVFIRRTQTPSDERIDGNNDSVYWLKSEGAEVIVRMAPEELSPASTKIALRDDEILICDVRRYGGQTTITVSDLDLSRRQDLSFLAAVNIPVDDGAWSTLSGPTIQDALDDADANIFAIWDWVSEHLDGSGDWHLAEHISVATATLGLIGDSTVQAVLEIVDDELENHFDPGFQMHIERWNSLGEALKTGGTGINFATRQMFAVKNGRGVAGGWGTAGKVRGVRTLHDRSGDGGNLTAIASDGRRIYYTQDTRIRALEQHLPDAAYVWQSGALAANAYSVGADGRFVYAGDLNGNYYIFDPATGALYHTSIAAAGPVKGIQGSGEYMLFAQGDYIRFANVVTLPPASGGAYDHGALVRDCALWRNLAYGTGTENASNHDVFCYDVVLDALQWTKNLNTDSAWQGTAIVADDRYVYVGGLDNTISAAGVNLFCLDRLSGQIVWQKHVNIFTDADVYALAVDDRYLWVSQGANNRGCVLDKRTGAYVDSFNPFVQSSSAVYLMDSDGECLWGVIGDDIVRCACGGPGVRLFCYEDNQDTSRVLYTLAPPLGGAFH